MVNWLQTLQGSRRDGYGLTNKLLDSLYSFPPGTTLSLRMQLG